MRDPLAIVRAAVADPILYKAAALALDECEPDEAAATWLAQAHDRGEASSWLVASLLGHLRHPAGYAKALELMRAGVTYAPHSLVSIAGVDAERDLIEAIETSEDGNVRRVAAGALGALGTESAIAYLVSAPARGRLRALSVAQALESAPLDARVLIDALRSPQVEMRRWPPMLIAMRLEAARRAGSNADVPDDAALRAALAAAIDEGFDVVWRADATILRAWLGADHPSG
ncbi:hypothetical protein [Sandaracinus amylolyticus]|uniref:HEAT repeat protein n=1 Tax=Sandaracinus amylolyticus TaxID=927083 RepID=A0A0F6YH91_9BACT|nr:hypothetical protein [Sandaracinus amylolyticus]AKF04495.1 hypothetical protein DB32_001644 [Sandaracinus amylolyticus]